MVGGNSMTNLSGKRCLIDTNILVAYINRSHPFHWYAKKIFQRIFKKEFNPVLSTQNLLELTTVLIQAFKIPQEKAIDDVRLFVKDPLFEIIYPNVN